MRASVYAIDRGNGVEWRMTLRPQIDIGYWARLYGRDCLVWLEPCLSLGQARLFVDRLNAVRALPDSIDRVRRELTKGLRAARMDPVLAQTIRITEEPSPRPFVEGRWAEAYGELLQTLAGRQLLEEELTALLAGSEQPVDGDPIEALQYAYLQGDVELLTGIEPIMDGGQGWRRKRTVFRCTRCGSEEKEHRWTRCPDCGGPCPYCETCLTMGRSRFCSLLVRGLKETPHQAETNSRGDAGRLDEELARWGLSPAQQAATAKALTFMAEPEGTRSGMFLLWAVTGAGKTEMLFPLIARARARGESVLLATPRRDVVVELLPRLQKAFQGETVIGLYGGSEQRWRQAGIVVATTHQAMRFHGAFELVVIDEVDAFPFHNNPMLQHAAAQARTSSGRTVLLSATPPEAMRRAAESGRLAHAKVPVRFHGMPLPVPRAVITPAIDRWIARGALPGRAKQAVARSIQRGAQLFVFVPRIKQIDPVVRLLEGAFPQSAVSGTSSEDAERSEKVAAFRGKAIDILVTTTILERGVTVPKTDVIVADADCALFDAAALIQMAGRAGRSAADPAGFATMLAPAYTQSQKEAIRQLKRMNKLAANQGFLTSRD